MHRPSDPPAAASPLTSGGRAKRLDSYFELMQREQAHVRKGNLRFALEELFRDVELEGKSVLDVGAGLGHASLFAACAGASRVMALEPEEAGSSSGMQNDFGRLRRLLGLEDRVELLPATFQQYDSGGETFDVLCFNASINHLDEQACIRLHRDEDARAAYHKIFAKLAAMATPRAKLIVSDCSRRNLFGDLGRRNPISPTIEWHKHQSPKLWANLLEMHGFQRPMIRWQSFNSLRRPGRALLGNRFASYLLTSSFCMTMELA